MNGFTDIHTHILPGVDDGAVDMEQAMELVRMAYENGTRNLVLTPHYRGAYKEYTPGRLLDVFAALRRNISQELPDMQLYLGQEIYYEMDVLLRMEEGRALTIHGSAYCLLEFRTNALSAQILAAVSEMVHHGYTPIIAHAELYDAFLNDRQLTDAVVRQGALIQLNADSVMGKQGFWIKRFCTSLLKRRKAHFIASDAHDEKKRPPLLRKCWWKVYKKYGKDYALQLFHDNAMSVIENQIY